MASNKINDIKSKIGPTIGNTYTKPKTPTKTETAASSVFQKAVINPILFLRDKTWKLLSFVASIPKALFTKVFRRKPDLAGNPLLPPEFSKNQKFKWPSPTLERLKSFLPYIHEIHHAAASINMAAASTVQETVAEFKVKEIIPSVGAEEKSPDIFVTEGIYHDYKSGFALKVANQQDETIVTIIYLNNPSQTNVNKMTAGELHSLQKACQEALKTVQAKLGNNKSRKIVFTGQEFGGTIAAYLALKTNNKAICFEARPLPKKLMGEFSAEALNKAPFYIKNLITDPNSSSLTSADKENCFGMLKVPASSKPVSKRTPGLGDQNPKILETILENLGYAPVSDPTEITAVDNLKKVLKKKIETLDLDFDDNDAVHKILKDYILFGVLREDQLNGTLYAFDLYNLSEKDVVSMFALAVWIKDQIKNEMKYAKTNRAINAALLDFKEQILRVYTMANYEEKKALIERIDELEKEMDLSKSPLYISLKKDLESFEENGSIFMPLEPAEEAQKLTTLANAQFSDGEDARPVDAPKRPRLLHAALEYRGAEKGGLGAVTKTLLPKQINYGHDARIVTPFWDFYHKDHENPKFCGFLSHEFDGKIVRSAVYRIKNGDTADKKGVTQYLIKPEPASRNLLFTVGNQESIYVNLNHSGGYDRMLYFSSAVAALAAEYRGKKRQKSFDILHLHAWHTGLAAELISKIYNPLRTKIGKSTIRTAFHIHMLSDEQGQCENICYERVGLTKNKKWVVKRNIQKDAMLASDLIFHVSKNSANESIQSKTGFGLHQISNAAFKQGKLKGITNGIDHKDYDPANPNLMKQFAVQRSFITENNGQVDTTDYLAFKKKCKIALAEKGIIADPDKPLFMFVGRYSQEKGIDMLPAMVEEVKKLGGQCVVMGTKDKNSPHEHLNVLQEASLIPENFLKFYSELSVQTSPFADTGVGVGKLIRFASDVVMVPSHLEACGLVPMESFSMGAFVVTSHVQGLKDMCINIEDAEMAEIVNGTADLSKSGFNSITYNNDSKKAENSIKAIQKAYKLLEALGSKRNQVISRLTSTASQYDWAAPNGALEMTEKSYRSVLDD